MTVELDNVIKNLNGKVLTLELFDEDGEQHLYLGTDSSSGAEYKVQSLQDVSEMLIYYLKNYYMDDEV